MQSKAFHDDRFVVTVGGGAQHSAYMVGAIPAARLPIFQVWTKDNAVIDWPLKRRKVTAPRRTRKTSAEKVMVVTTLVSFKCSLINSLLVSSEV